jgi:hypothetical protein
MSVPAPEEGNTSHGMASRAALTRKANRGEDEENKGALPDAGAAHVTGVGVAPIHR